jgi:hypothetical protein
MNINQNTQLLLEIIGATTTLAIIGAYLFTYLKNRKLQKQVLNLIDKTKTIHENLAKSINQNDATLHKIFANHTAEIKAAQSKIAEQDIEIRNTKILISKNAQFLLEQMSQLKLTQRQKPKGKIIKKTAKPKKK